MKYQINIDPNRYYKKPRYFGCINNSLNNIEELTIEEFAIQVGKKGRAFTRALLRGGRKEENFIQQDFLVLDFDNTISYDAFINRCMEYEIIPIFTYRTFGWSRKEERFRAVFRMDITVTNIYFAKAVNGMLQQLFPEADPKCSDIPRFFLGGKKLIEVNPDACAEIEDIRYALQRYMKIIKENNKRK